MHAGMPSGLKRRFDDDLSPITLRSMSKYRLMVTLERAGLTSMHHAPSFAALTSTVHLHTSKIIGLYHKVEEHGTSLYNWRM